MLDKLAMYNKGNFRELACCMLMLEDMVKEKSGPFGTIMPVDLIMTKFGKYKGGLTERDIKNYSKFLLTKLLKYYGYFKLNDELELNRWGFYI